MDISRERSAILTNGKKRWNHARQYFKVLLTSFLTYEFFYFVRINFHEKFYFFRLKTLNLTKKTLKKTLKTLNFNKYSEWPPWIGQNWLNVLEICFRELLAEKHHLLGWNCILLKKLSIFTQFPGILTKKTLKKTLKTLNFNKYSVWPPWLSKKYYC